MRTLRFGALLTSALLLSPASLAAQASATVHGTVMDSVRGTPLTGATVVLFRSGTDRGGESIEARSGKGGKFSVEVPPGRYIATAEHPSLDSTGSVVVPLTLDLASGSTSDIMLATPSPAALKGRACPGVALDSLTGAVLGRVEDARDRSPVPGATVVVQWDELEAHPRNGGITVRTHTVDVKTDTAGLFALCGIPMMEPLRAQVQHGTAASGVLALMISHRGVLTRAFTIETSVVGTSAESLNAVKGTITGTEGAPLHGARVRIAGDTLEATTDERGDFDLRTRLAGSQTLEAVALGYQPGSTPVEVVATSTPVVTLRLEKVVAVLEAMRTLATRASVTLKQKEFESRRHSKRGLFITPELIASRNPFQMSDLLRDLPGYRPPTSRGYTSIQLAYQTTGDPTAPRGRGAKELTLAALGIQSGLSSCPHVYVDGIRDKSGNGIDALPPEWVYGVEIYKRGDGSAGRFENRCGLILIWTK